MSLSHDLILQKPVSILNAPAKLNFKEFFSSLGKSVVAGSFGDYKGALEYGIDALKEAGLQDSPEQVTWTLISHSLMRALNTLAEEYSDLLDADLDETALEDLAERVEHTLNSVEISIDASFFERPQDLPLLEDFKSALVFWLKSLGMDEYQADAFHYRMKGQFVLALHEQWSKNPEDYACITQQLDTPFTNASLEQRAWRNYRNSLKQQADERVFGEAFGLRRVYIPLRAYYKEKQCNGHKDKDTDLVVCDLHENIHSWLKQFKKDNALRVISGGPGSGKSSFAKVLASELAEKNEIPVLFIPLHHFNLTDDLIDAVGSFVRDDRYLRSNPLVNDTRQERLLLIFDGLDELAEQGKAANDIAQQFIDELIRVLERHNDNGNRWQAIVTGRELSVQANETRLRKQQQVLHILPYHLTDDEQKKYQDTENLLEADQRHLWWKKFGEAKGQSYTALPEALSTKHLQPITREPLLNYLLSLSYERQEIEFNDQTSLNTIYYDLLKAVHEREYDGHQHDASKHLDFDDFLEILEEIALAVWHGNGRTASESYLLQRCEEAGLTRHLDCFSEGAKKGVVRLLTAFYFRQFGTESDGDRTFEFTHKSFGEYLTARRIVSTVETTCEEIARNKQSPRKGWTQQQALIKWIEVTGPTAIDEYMLRFIQNEIAIHGILSIQQWQQTFIELLGIVVREGSPMEQVVGLPTFAAMLHHSRNSEIFLLAIHNTCAVYTQDIVSVDWGQNSNFGIWLKRVQGQRGTKSDSSLVLNFLSYLYLAGQNLSYSDLCSANLENSDLRHSNLEYSNLMGANLNQTDFLCADLSNSDMREVSAIEAALWGAYLNDVNLTGADLINTNLSEADLTLSDLSIADLSGAKLIGANLRAAHLHQTDFSGADLRGADLRGIDSDTAAEDLKSANLQGAGF